MSKPRSAPNGVGTGKYVKVSWHDNGHHTVEIVGVRRRHDIERLLRAVRRHCLACQVRGLPLDTAETQRPGASEEAEAAANAGERH